MTSLDLSCSLPYLNVSRRKAKFIPYITIVLITWPVQSRLDDLYQEHLRPSPHTLNAEQHDKIHRRNDSIFVLYIYHKQAWLWN